MFAHKHGLRIAQKILYSALWEKWREAYGLPAPFPYVFDILKHDDDRRITIEDFYRKKPSRRASVNGKQQPGASRNKGETVLTGEPD